MYSRRQAAAARLPRLAKAPHTHTLTHRPCITPPSIQLAHTLTPTLSHRPDSKPQNVLLHGGLAKVADFGCCKVLAAPQGQQSGCVEESMQAGSATGSCGGDGSGRGGSSGGGEQAADAEPQAAVPPPPPAEAAGGLDRGSGSGGSGDSVLGALAGRLFPRSRGAVLGSSAAAVASSFVVSRGCQSAHPR